MNPLRRYAGAATVLALAAVAVAAWMPPTAARPSIFSDWLRRYQGSSCQLVPQDVTAAGHRLLVLRVGESAADDGAAWRYTLDQVGRDFIMLRRGGRAMLVPHGMLAVIVPPADDGK